MERPEEQQPGQRIDPGTGEPLREEDVTQQDRLDDRVSEGEGLPDGDGGLGRVGEGEEFPPIKRGGGGS